MFEFANECSKRHQTVKRLIVRVLILSLFIIIVTFGLIFYIPYGQWRQIADKPTYYECNIEGIKFKGKTGDFIDNSIYYFGGWELYELHALRDFMRCVSPKQGVFLDIGANIGTHSLYMSKYAARVIAVEPYPPVLKRLQSLIALNRMTNIQVLPVGFSNKEGSLPFYAPPDYNIGTGSFESSWSRDNRLLGNLRLVVGDKHLAEQGIDRVDLIKVDIEGFERYALMGLKNILRKNRPIVVFELNIADGGFRSKDKMLETFPDAYDFYYLDLKKFRGSRGYHIAKFGSFIYCFGPYVRAGYTLKPFDFSFNKQANIVAVPHEKTGKLFVQ